MPACPRNCTHDTHTHSRAAQSTAAPCNTGTRERWRSRASFPAPLRQSRRVPLTLLQTAVAFGTRDRSRTAVGADVPARWDGGCHRGPPIAGTGEAETRAGAPGNSRTGLGERVPWRSGSCGRAGDGATRPSERVARPAFAQPGPGGAPGSPGRFLRAPLQISTLTLVKVCASCSPATGAGRDVALNDN